MMSLCIQLKIPIFIVGKPGSSKSLAKTIVGDVMQGWVVTVVKHNIQYLFTGPNSYSDLYKSFKEIHTVRYIFL